MLRGTGQWQGNRTPDNQAANKLVDAGGIWFEDVGSTPTASISNLVASRLTDRFNEILWIDTYRWMGMPPLTSIKRAIGYIDERNRNQASDFQTEPAGLLRSDGRTSPLAG